jgi:hypothetical protein
MLLQYPDDLFFRKAIALHALVLKMGQNELQTGLAQRGKVTATRRWTLPVRSMSVSAGRVI